MEPQAEGLDAFRRALEVRPAPLLGPFAPECVYYYTTASGFSGILNEKAIRATNYSFLNDSSEVHFGRTIVERCLEGCRLNVSTRTSQFIDAITQSLDFEAVAEVYVACFSGLEDDLSQWRAYGTSPAERFALGFDAPQLERLALEDGNAVYARVLYEQSEQEERVRYLINKALRLFEADASAAAMLPQYSTIVAKHLARILPLLKNDSYKPEAEWRLVVWRRRGGHDPKFETAHGSLRPYLLMTLGDDPPIVDAYALAPNRMERARKAADMCLEAAGITHVKSKIPFAD